MKNTHRIPDNELFESGFNPNEFKVILNSSQYN